MKKNIYVMICILSIMSIVSCKNIKDTIAEEERADQENQNNKTVKIIGGNDVIEDSEYATLGGILGEANPEDLKKLQDSLDMDEIQKLSQQEKDKLVDDLGEISENHSAVVKDVQEALEENNVNVALNETTGKITMDEKILFGKNEYDLSNEGKQYLDSFFATYANAILDSSAENCVSSIQIIGHTDTSGDYDYNKKLSEKRANAVKDYCLKCKSLKKEQKNRLVGMLKAIGKSYDEPVYDGKKVDMEASRRVEFKIIMSVN